MKKVYTTLGAICLSVLTLTVTAQNTQKASSTKEGLSVFYKTGVLTAKPVASRDAAGGGPCTVTADTWTDLNGAGGAPCFDTDQSACVETNPGWTTIGVYGSETYVLDGVEAGFDYVFDMCSGVGAGSWIPEIVILAPDGTTIDASNNASSTSGATHADQCSIEWTASQSGEYSIIINEMGTAAGDAPSQTGCETSLAVDNGNPTVVCGTNPATCGPAGPCEAGDLTSALAQSVCPADSAEFAMSGTISADGGFMMAYSDALGGTGGATGGFTIGGYTAGDFPLMVNNDVNGILSANSLPVLEGDWAIKIYALDGAGDPCDSTEVTVVTFLPASDPSCAVSITEETLNLDVYPNPSNGNVIIEMTGDNSDASISVYDMTGRVVYSEAVVISSNYRKVLDLNVVDGSYILSIVGDKAVVTRKLEIRK